MIRLVLVLALAFPCASFATTKTWIVVGDSIMSYVADGAAAQHALALVQAERGVYIKNISSPGAALGVKDHTGFNTPTTAETIKAISGFFGYYEGIIVQAATNDYGRSIPVNDTLDGLRRILDTAQASGKKVLLLDPIWRAGEGSPNALGWTLDTYRFWMATVCNQYAGTCRWASRANTVMGTASGASFYSAAEVAAGTQLHPNAAGQRHLADWIKAEAAAAGYF